MHWQINLQRLINFIASLLLGVGESKAKKNEPKHALYTLLSVH